MPAELSIPMNVDFKPPKRMKKRRELDALVTHTKAVKGGHKRKKGQHELLVNDSESSEFEEFGIAQKTVMRKRGGACRFCGTCVTACGAFLLLACISAVGGLIWVHIELKTDFDALQAQLMKVASNQQGTPQDISDLQNKQQDLEQKLNKGTENIDQIQKSLTDVLSKLGELTSSTNKLKDQLDAAPSLAKLPQSVQDITEQMAVLGSNLQSATHDKKNISDELKALDARLTFVEQRIPSDSDTRESGQGGNPATEPPAVPTPPPGPDNDAKITALQEYANRIMNTVTSVNSSVYSTIDVMKRHSMTHTANLDTLFNTTQVLSSRLSTLEADNSAVISQQIHLALLNISQPTSLPSAASAAQIEKIITDLGSVETRVTSVESTVQMLITNNGGLEHRPVMTTVAATTSEPTDLEGNSPPSTPAHKMFATYAEFEKGFEMWDVDRNGLVDPINMGEVPRYYDLEKFDSDGDGKYSIDELKVALDVPEESTFDPSEETHPNGKRNLR
ncbi:hypothetical protein CAPTEDRAFT_218855 [Capitella teleta]|uniref:EF-hand domain-containing protein n=1 Tax=Capitella teleta TaxID=283909 RepID=R7TBD1_CAPTE|nr:hypothetical protein CAPTEDRAFT_218855 [Capitella teleta]|eukprot:ELT88319.1 hypothetical protein CAPTEDRAFT_218855 [Capitella teleta]